VHCKRRLFPVMPDEKEIRDAIEQEKHPERKYTKSEMRGIERDLERIYKEGDEKKLMQFLRAIGLKDESPEFARVVNVFRSLPREKP